MDCKVMSASWMACSSLSLTSFPLLLYRRRPSMGFRTYDLGRMLRPPSSGLFVCSLSTSAETGFASSVHSIAHQVPLFLGSRVIILNQDV